MDFVGAIEEGNMYIVFAPFNTSPEVEETNDTQVGELYHHLNTGTFFFVDQSDPKRQWFVDHTKRSGNRYTIYYKDSKTVIIKTIYIVGFTEEQNDITKIKWHTWPKS